MPNMAKNKVPMPHQAPDVRRTNFSEVATGYDAQMAFDEATRCLNCKNPPCVQGCPVGVKIPEFIQKIVAHDEEGAYNTITSTNALPAICGRVCPQESQCESRCVRGIKAEPVAIGRLERYVADKHAQNTDAVYSDKPQPNGIKVAAIGSGPASLTFAGQMARRGFDVTVFEAFHSPGGVLVYGIPEFRLPKDIVAREIKNLEQSGVKICTNMVIGKVFSVEKLISEKGYKGVFIGSGAGLPSFLNIPGESLNGVYSANEFLTRINLMKAYKFPEYDTPVNVGKNVCVIGGGNVAMDAARCAVRMGAEIVTIIYRRSEEELPARAEEIAHAKEEGIEFKLLTNPVEILEGDGFTVRGLKCVKMELSEKDASGRRKPVAIQGSEFEVPCDTVIVAVGQTPNPLIQSTTPGLETTPRGGIVIDEATGRTSIERVYAGGDAVTGAATVILAMGAGKLAAENMAKELLGTE